MTGYAVYLEHAAGGPGLAHIPDLLGCVVRAPTCDEVLRNLPSAIHDYYTWLRRHGEPTPLAGEPIEFEIAGESAGFGPFGPGDAAALLPTDQEPLLPEEAERYFRLMAHTRADLPALVHAPSTGEEASLPQDLLDWQPDPQSWSIGRLLRHVGDAEEWYVSRLVPPETLPAEWENDAELPIFEFLEMERRTAVARLRQLTADERTGVFHPALGTHHPDEAWTARKALRRFLEHEWEHTAQVRQILAANRRHLLTRLAAERARLLGPLAGLDDALLTGERIVGEWTIKDVLAHIAAWDRWQHGAMQSLLAGGLPDLARVEDVSAYNAVVIAEWRGRTVAEVMAELQSARDRWVTWLEELAEEAFFQPRSIEGHDWSFPSCVAIQWRHDAEHAQQIAVWLQARALR